MTFWFTLGAYEAVWFSAVIGASHGLAWPGVLAAALFAGWRITVSEQRQIELRLIAAGLLLGATLESAWVYGGLIRYAADWPMVQVPAWILALWIAFGLTIVPLFGYLHERPWLAALLGAIGGPLSYFAAARGWHVAFFEAPDWQIVIAMAFGWGIALPALTQLARHLLRAASLSPDRVMS